MKKKVQTKGTLDSMQFGFTSGKGTTDATFIVREMQEKYLAKKKDLWMAFVDLEKAFDRMTREVVWWALRKVDVEEWFIKVIQSMYVRVTTAVRMKGAESKEFEMKAGVHQGFVLSPLLFTIVLVPLAESREISMEKIKI